MKLIRSLTAGALAGVLVFGALWLWLPAHGAPEAQDALQQSPGIAGMHAACLSGDATAMRGSMDALTEDDWADMARHMSDGVGSTGGTMGGHPDMMDGQGDTMDGMMNGAGGMMGMMP